MLASPSVVDSRGVGEKGFFVDTDLIVEKVYYKKSGIDRTPHSALGRILEPMMKTPTSFVRHAFI